MAMKFHREAASEFAITAYTARSISVSGVEFHASVQVKHDAAAAPWPVAAFSEIDAAALAAAALPGTEIVIVGTGRRLRFPPPSALRPLIEARIGYEVMDTAAACRTYNVLLGEGRQVAALLLIEGETAPA